MPLWAETINIGYISLTPDVFGFQVVGASNQTGGCNSIYQVCSEVAITNWQFTVFYDNINSSSFRGSDINPGFDYSLFLAPDLLINSITFAGELATSSVEIYISDTSHGYFFPQPFSVTMTPVQGYGLKDIIVSDQPSSNPVPEPELLVLLAVAGAVAGAGAALRQLLRRSQ